MPTVHHTRTRASYAKKFSGRYAHRTITGGVGHNLPQEAPQAFAEAVIEVDEIREAYPGASFGRSLAFKRPSRGGKGKYRDGHARLYRPTRQF